MQRYISSGIIESYVVGLVSEQEAREVESAIAEYPEIREAVEACRQDMERYVELYAVSPPKDIRSRILDAIENESSPEGEELLPEELREPGEAAADRPARPAFKLTPLRVWQIVALLAVAGMLISILFNNRYAGQLEAQQVEYASLQANQAALKEEYQAAMAKLDDVTGELNVLKDPDIKWTRLYGTGKHAGQLATVGWNPESKEVYLRALSLPEPGPGQQYQLWALYRGKPVDAGVFEMGKQQHALQKMKPVTAVQVFIITLEKKGGSATPALDQLFVAGRP
ncbi:anti-sigma factor [Chitinophaga japonensis]|uniref:anti-sigma factor n=1 Tax=Chitinophaga japonensis TaxID=104662 RepID=UPI00119F0574|nr:anti-sigma factor [Chitinophaga japonensis]